MLPRGACCILTVDIAARIVYYGCVVTGCRGPRVEANQPLLFVGCGIRSKFLYPDPTAPQSTNRSGFALWTNNTK